MWPARFGHGLWFADPGWRCLEVVRVTVDDVINDPKTERLKTNWLRSRFCGSGTKTGHSGPGFLYFMESEASAVGRVTWLLGLKLPEGSFTYPAGAWVWMTGVPAVASPSRWPGFLIAQRPWRSWMSCMGAQDSERVYFSEPGRSCITFYDPDSKVAQHPSAGLC